MASTIPSANTTYINQLVMHDHEVGRGNIPPKLFRLDHYWMWKIRFQDYLKRLDMELWYTMTEGCVWPETTNAQGESVRYKYADMPEVEKKKFGIESKALTIINQALPQECLHLFRKYTTSKSLWDALESYCEGDENLKEGRIKQIKRQFEAFNSMGNESLEETIMRFYHLMSELQYFEITYSDRDINDKFLDALPKAWTAYASDIQESADYKTLKLENVVSRIRGRNNRLQLKDDNRNFVQDPSLYHAVPNSLTGPGLGLMFNFVKKMKSEDHLRKG
jgi:hypothetical protein